MIARKHQRPVIIIIFLIERAPLPRFHSAAKRAGASWLTAWGKPRPRSIGRSVKLTLDQFPGPHVQYCRRVLMECAPTLADRNRARCHRPSITTILSGIVIETHANAGSGKLFRRARRPSSVVKAQRAPSPRSFSTQHVGGHGQAARRSDDRQANGNIIAETRAVDIAQASVYQNSLCGIRPPLDRNRNRFAFSWAPRHSSASSFARAGPQSGIGSGLQPRAAP